MTTATITRRASEHGVLALVLTGHVHPLITPVLELTVGQLLN
jgi:hypothetical protein